jgi:hypothetical protein
VTSLAAHDFTCSSFSGGTALEQPRAGAERERPSPREFRRTTRAACRRVPVGRDRYAADHTAHTFGHSSLLWYDLRRQAGEAFVVEFLEGGQVDGDDVQDVVGLVEEPLRRVLGASDVKAEEA